MSEKSTQLLDWEVAIIRAMLAGGGINKQDIISYFSRPGRSINPARIHEIEIEHPRYRGIPPATREELDRFLAEWEMIRFPSAPIVRLSATDPKFLATMFRLRSHLPPRLAVSETNAIEAKETFNWGSRTDYCKTLAAMSNNKGGYILFGVKDATFEVVGIPADRMDRFDIKKANEYISRTFNQSLEVEKGHFDVAGFRVGVLYVAPSTNKPVVCTVDGGGMFSGDIFFRYPGESRRVQAPEFEQLLRERDKSAEGRLLSLVRKISESGPGDAAIINLSSGEVSGERGKFVIDQELLSKVKFITEGRLSDHDGAPTLRVVGDVVPLGSPQITINQSVMGAIGERHILDAFLKQQCEFDPKIYIQSQALLQPLWMPIYFFAVKAGLSKLDLIALIQAADSPYKQRIAKHVERIKRVNYPPAPPARSTVQSELHMLKGSDPIVTSDKLAVKRFLSAMRLMTPEDVELDRLLSVVTEMRSRFGGVRELQADIRYALATIDIRWFYKKLKMAV